MNACMLVYMYVCIYEHMYCVCTNIYRSILCMYICLYVHMYERMYVCIYVHMHA